jgi:hypothetical protein
MPTRFGATDTPACPECKNLTRLTRRTPHPMRGYDFELQTFTCRLCEHETNRTADLLGEVPTIPEGPRPLWPLETVSGDQDHARWDRALEDLMIEHQGIDDFIKRLSYTIENIVRKK